MNGEFADDVLRTLHDADPSPNLEAPAALRARIADIPSTRTASAAGRRRRWLVPLAAAAAAAAAIGGGYLWGTGGVDLGATTTPLAVETGTPDDPTAPLQLEGNRNGGALTGTQELQTQGVLPGAIAGMGQSPAGHRFIIPALATASSTANVFAIDAGTQSSAKDAARMAGTLGLTGDVHEDELGSGWRVGDGSGPFLILRMWGEASFYSGIPDAVSVCEDKATALHGRTKVNDDGTWAFGQEMIRCMADTPLPSDTLVKKSVSLFLAAIGIDEASTRIEVTPDESGRTVMATAALLVENNVTDVVARVTVSAQGIMHASGPTGAVVSLGAYPLASPAEAATRLNSLAFSPRIASWPESSAEPDLSPMPTEPPAVPTAGSAVPWPIEEHEIISVRLGLALAQGSGGAQLLVPTYEFTASDDTVWTVIALDEDHPDTTAPPRG